MYPRILGGTSGSTTFHSIDLEPTQQLDMAIGGETSDSGVAGTLIAAPDPILVYMINGGLYKWGFKFGSVFNLDRVNTVKFNPTGTTINAFITNSLTWFICVLSVTDGNMIKAFR